MTTDGWSDEGPPWARAPKDWPAVSAAAVHDTIDRVLLILVDQRQVAIERLDDFVGQGGDRSSLLRLPREAPDDVAAVDLLAVSHAVGRLDARSLSRVLHRGAYHELLADAFRALPTTGLAMVDDEGLRAMERTLEAAVVALGRARMTAPAALCARKRPDLFPWFTAETEARLGLADKASHRVSWLLTRAVVGEPMVIRALDEVLDGVTERSGFRFLGDDAGPLRALDSAMTAWGTGRTG